MTRNRLKQFEHHTNMIISEAVTVATDVKNVKEKTLGTGRKAVEERMEERREENGRCEYMIYVIEIEPYNSGV